MLFRTLQLWYDLFSYGDGRAIEEQNLRDREWREWHDRQIARRLGKEVPKKEFKIEAPSQEFYETTDGVRAAKLVEQQRHEEGRSKRYPRNLTEAHQQAEDAEQEGWAETLRDAFGDFDEENRQGRIDRLRKELNDLLGEEEKPKGEWDWEEINSKPARGWTLSSNGEAYQQMVELRSPVQAEENSIESHPEESKPEKPVNESIEKVEAVGKIEPIEESEPAAENPIDWESVNAAAKGVKSREQALQYQRMAERLDKSELAEFWQQLADEYEDEYPEEEAA